MAVSFIEYTQQISYYICNQKFADYMAVSFIAFFHIILFPFFIIVYNCMFCMLLIFSNNGRHPATKNFTALHYTTLYPTTIKSTSPQLSTLHFLPFKLRPTTLHSTSLHLSTLHFLPFKLHPTSLYSTSLHLSTPLPPI